MHQTGHALAVGSQESFALESAVAKAPALSISLRFTTAVDVKLRLVPRYRSFPSILGTHQRIYSPCPHRMLGHKTGTGVKSQYGAGTVNLQPLLLPLPASSTSRAGCKHKHTSSVVALCYWLPLFNVLLSTLHVGYITRQRHAQCLWMRNPCPRRD